MVNKLLGAAALLAGASLSALPANAQIATITVTGTVSGGTDATGKFGPAGGTIAGLPFSAIFTVEQKPGSATTTTPSMVELFGKGSASPVSASLTLGSGTINFGGSLQSWARSTNGVTGTTVNGVDGLFYYSDDTDLAALPPPPMSTFFYVNIASVRDLFAQADFMSFATIDLQAEDHASGLAQVANLDTTTGTYGPGTYVVLAPKTISAKVTPAVPEPATWAMMVVGFGVAGAAMRRRTRTTAKIAFA